MSYFNRLCCSCLSLMFLLYIPASFSSEISGLPLTFAMFAPRSDSFWPKQEAFMKAACADLHIRCLVYYANDNQNEMKRQMKAVVTGPDKVDAVLFQNYKKQGLSFIQLADKNNVAAFLINAPLSDEKYKVAGKPREKYKHWLGEMIPDDQQAGYINTNKIIDAALLAGKYGVDGKVKLIAINGAISDGATIEREKGLHKALIERKDAHLYQHYTTRNWSKRDAILKYTGALSRYPDVNAIWTGDDDIAFAIIQTARNLDLIPGKDFFIAGIDWSEEGINAVKRGEMTVNVGGHFLEAAWATIMLYDYFHGIDFKNEGVQVKSPMYPIDKHNVTDITELFTALKEDRIDFASFSKHLNPKVKHYHFDVSQILEQIKR